MYASCNQRWRYARQALSNVKSNNKLRARLMRAANKLLDVEETQFLLPKLKSVGQFSPEYYYPNDLSTHFYVFKISFNKHMYPKLFFQSRKMLAWHHCPLVCFIYIFRTQYLFILYKSQHKV